MVMACGVDSVGPGVTTVKFGKTSAKIASGITTDGKARAPGRL